MHIDPQKFSFMTKPQLPNVQQTVANMILIINIGNSNTLNKFWVGIFTRQGHISQVYWTAVIELESEWQGLTIIGLRSDKNFVK